MEPRYRIKQVEGWFEVLEQGRIVYLVRASGVLMSSKEVVRLADGHLLVWHAIDDTDEVLSKEDLWARLIDGEWKDWQADPRLGQI